MSTGSTFLCGMTLFNPRPFHPISEFFISFQTFATSQRYSSDPDSQPKLSPDQQKNSCVWKRPNQRPGQSVDILRRRILPEDILQHIVTDCSVCASISVCLEHSRRFGSTVSASIFSFGLSCLEIFHSLQYHLCRPLKWMADMIFGFCLMVHIVEWVFFFLYKNHTLTPESSRSVKYRFLHPQLLLINTSQVIDDKLPLNPTDGTLMCMSILPPHPTSKEGNLHEEISWPSLLEKAVRSHFSSPAVV